MNKPQRNNQQPKKQSQALPIIESQEHGENCVPDGIYPRDSSGKKIEPERFCPICWGRYKGYGTAEKTTERGTRYYKCNRVIPGSEFGPCGFTWSMSWQQIESARAAFLINCQQTLITYREVNIDGKRD